MIDEIHQRVGVLSYDEEASLCLGLLGDNELVKSFVLAALHTGMRR